MRACVRSCVCVYACVCGVCVCVCNRVCIYSNGVTGCSVNETFPDDTYYRANRE